MKHTSTSSSQSASATYLTTNVVADGLSNTTALTRSSTSGTVYYTAAQTTGTTYLTRQSVSGYGTRASTSATLTRASTSGYSGYSLSVGTVTEANAKYEYTSGDYPRIWNNVRYSAYGTVQQYYGGDWSFNIGAGPYTSRTIYQGKNARIIWANGCDAYFTPSYGNEYTIYGTRAVISTVYYTAANSAGMQGVTALTRSSTSGYGTRASTSATLTRASTSATNYGTKVITTNTVYQTRQSTSGYSGISSSSSSESASATTWA